MTTERAGSFVWGLRRPASVEASVWQCFLLLLGISEALFLVLKYAVRGRETAGHSAEGRTSLT